jgi:hypothetical protein
MVSLTPQQNNEAVSNAAFREGFINGSIAFVPSYGAIWLAMKTSPRFLKVSTLQCTVLCIAVRLRENE